ncbi:YybH family protein [Nocardia arthritidis]|uniref:DUF4440 domain-containing protein n=1 Tax=Nocardia arthritidis TaxID=228602 RepID=A0A6G9YGH2_9NOCA|nr:nuclear transport factor 2 family protein [Nocardia arthritidis]QIS12329.1 DUF4440 domain-containing protein [Nocardia arthritidis]
MTIDHDAPLRAELAEFIARWVQLFNNNDLAALDELYEPDGITVPTAGNPARGQDRSAANAHLRGYGLPIQAHLRHCYPVGDIALLVVDWSMNGVTAQGYPLDLHGSAADVVRRDEHGRWRYLIDNPFGTK